MIALYKYRNRIETVTPYNQAFVKDAQRLRGTWGKDIKRWAFKIEDIERVISSLCDCYGVSQDKITFMDYSELDSNIGPAFEVEISRPVEVEPVDGDPDWKKLNNKDLVDLYLAIEQELRRRKL